MTEDARVCAVLHSVPDPEDRGAV